MEAVIKPEKTLLQKTEENEKKYRNLIQISPDAVIIIDEEGLITDWNLQAEKMFGWKESELVGKTLPQTIIPEKFRVAAKAGLEHFLITGEGPVLNKPIELIGLRKDDIELPIELKISSTKINDKYIFIGFVRDITERKKSEEDLLKSEQKFKALLESAPDAMVIIDKKGIITLINAQTERLFGYNRTELYGNTIEMLIPQRFREKHISHRSGYFHEPKAREMGVGLDLFGRKKDGSEFPADISLNYIKTDEGILASAAIRDITERKSVERRIKENEEQFRLLVENIKDYAIIMLDSDGNIKSWNKGAESINGYSADEIIGKNISVFYTQDEINRKEPEQNLKKAKEKGRYENEALRVRKDGSQFFADVIYTSLYDDKNNFRGFLKVTRDITQRKKNEEEINLLNIELTAKVNELEISNKEMESFSYSVSHDLRAPIRSINGFSKIIEKNYASLFDKDGKEYLNIIIKESVRLAHLIDDLLSFSRLGKKELQKTMVDMEALAKEVADELFKSEENQLKVKINIKPLPACYCDDTLIRQVFVNLISNAIKFSSTQPEPSIEIGYTAEKDSTTYYVKDNGVGFDMKFYDKLFGVFERLHNPDEFPGTGIGLSIVKRIIVRHGGKVWAEGKVNGGATFYFSLLNLDKEK